MRGIALAILLVLAAPAIAAETVTVRSGEHGDFTRLTFAIPEDTPWSVAERMILFPVDGIQFDTSSVFERIDTSRLEGIETRGGRVTLELACECILKGFLASKNLLVVDIHPGAPETIQPVTTLPNLLELSDAPPEVVWPEDSYTNFVIPEISGPTAAPSLNENSQTVDLAYAISRAASLGLVNQTSLTHEHPTSSAETVPRAVQQMRAHAATDVGVVLAGEEPIASVCPDEKAVPKLSSVSWEDIGELRKAITLPTGRPDKLSAKALASAYLSMGFGAEVLAILEGTGQQTDDYPGYLALVRLFDGADSERNFFTATMMTCGGDVGFWSFLTHPDARQADSIDLASVLTTFLDLPDSVQSIVSKKLSSALIARDRLDLAEIVRQAEHYRAQGRSDILLIGAELALAKGDENAASDMLDEAVALDGEAAPQALTAKMELSLEAGLTVSADDIDQARALFGEFENTPEGDTLFQTTLEAMVSLGQLQAALELAKQSEDKRTAETVLTWALHYLSDEELAWAAFKFTDKPTSEISQDLQDQLAEVLTRLEFRGRGEDAQVYEPMASHDVMPDNTAQTFAEEQSTPISVRSAKELAETTGDRIREFNDFLSGV